MFKPILGLGLLAGSVLAGSRDTGSEASLHLNPEGVRYMTLVFARCLPLLVAPALLLGACAGAGQAVPSSSVTASAAPASAPAAKPSAATTQASPASGQLAATGAVCTGSSNPDPQNCVAALKVTANATLGNILTDDRGNTLYYYDDPTTLTAKDPSKCAYGPILGHGGPGIVNTCLGAWPPLVTADMPATPPGITGKLNVIARADLNNTKQVTYNGAPLYYFRGDRAPGDVNGNA